MTHPHCGGILDYIYGALHRCRTCGAWVEVVHGGIVPPADRLYVPVALEHLKGAAPCVSIPLVRPRRPHAVGKEGKSDRRRVQGRHRPRARGRRP